MEQHSSHQHSHLREATKQTTHRLLLSLFLTLAFVIEAGVGMFANILALLNSTLALISFGFFYEVYHRFIIRPR